MTQQEQEAYVRAWWQRVQYSETGLTDVGPCYVTINAGDYPLANSTIFAGSTIFMKHGQTKEAVFAAAFDFTVAREEEIRQLEEKIRRARRRIPWLDWNNGWWNNWPPYSSTNASLVDVVRDVCSMNRTLARLQQALEDLTKGMVKA
jgi:hypothetical protein